MPTVIAFKDGQPIDQFVGALNEAGVRNFIQKL
jgi:thioredoxin 1